MTVESRERIFRARGSRASSLRASHVTGNVKSSRNRRVPLFIPADEVYYWSSSWQQDVAESMAALRSGDYVDFDSNDPKDVAHWLLSVDEDDCD
jgi:hypothetical protein